MTAKRITILSGHYGSGKTECAVSLAMALSRRGPAPWQRLALIDLDVANPYFRARERRDMLEQSGVRVYADAYGAEITAELPALTAQIRTPLEDADCRVIVDLGGNDAGARVLKQFRKYFEGDEHELLAVVNFSRYETHDVDSALSHLDAIRRELGMEVNGIVNNCHLLRETTALTVRHGHDMCRRLSSICGIPLVMDAYPTPLVGEGELADLGGQLLPLGMYMRQSWLDR